MTITLSCSNPNNPIVCCPRPNASKFQMSCHCLLARKDKPCWPVKKDDVKHYQFAVQKSVLFRYNEITLNIRMTDRVDIQDNVRLVKLADVKEYVNNLNY